MGSGIALIYLVRLRMQALRFIIALKPIFQAGSAHGELGRFSHDIYQRRVLLIWFIGTILADVAITFTLVSIVSSKSIGDRTRLTDPQVPEIQREH